MNENAPVIEIMWKEILLILLAVFVLRGLLAQYLVVQHRRFVERYYMGKWSGLKNACEKHKRIAHFIAGGPLNPWGPVIYNDFCLIIASMAYLEGDIDTFLEQLHLSKKTKLHSLTPAFLACYYRSVDDFEKANQHYAEYTLREKKDKNVTVVLEHLFAAQQSVNSSTESIVEALNDMKNPALLKLLEQNGITKR